MQNVKAIDDDLNKYDYLAKEGDFIIVTEWMNDEGIDVSINDEKNISLTFGQLDAINYLMNTLKYNKVKNNDGERND